MLQGWIGRGQQAFTGLRAVTTSDENQHLLFPIQPWELNSSPPLSDELQRERDTLQAALADSRLGQTEQRVAFILQRFPETRDSDNALAIRYWKHFQADVLEAWDRLDLDVLYQLDHFETISRIRRHIQNDLRLFTSSASTRRRRDELQMEFYQYLAKQREAAPEIRFYLDETGIEGGKAYTGLAGICVLDWRQYEKHWASLNQWRNAQGWPETIHFVDTGSAAQPKALALLHELQRRRGGLLFVGYAMPSRGSTNRTLASVFVQLIADSLQKLKDLHCLDVPRSLVVVKEANEGFDNVFLSTLDHDIAEHVGREFPERVYLKEIQPVPKGREVLLECADLIAGGMQRRALYAGRNPKDVLAEAVFNVTGFDDPRDSGTVFKAHPS